MSLKSFPEVYESLALVVSFCKVCDIETISKLGEHVYKLSSFLTFLATSKLHCFSNRPTENLITLCTYVQQGYVFGHVGLCAYVCTYIYIYIHVNKKQAV